MRKLSIYFGDLTHDTVGLATEVFPLNVGFIASYARKVFGEDIQVQLFKYIHRLEEAIERDPPDILALSNYPWCHNANKALFQLLANRRPEAIRIMGGPNFPHDVPGQRQFLIERPWLDAYVYLDGEVGFANLVALVGNAASTYHAREVIHSVPAAGCVQLKPDGTLVNSAPQPRRLLQLDEIPSPYLTGLLDPFFDGRLSPMLQTNRGCPFRCTFCHDGNENVNKVANFSLERVKAEINYIVERVPANTTSLFISDLNFGMYKRDLEICETIAEAQRSRGYPRYIDTTTGKNQKARVISAVEKLSGALHLTMSVQSMTQSVLKNIKRDNIRLGDFIALEPVLRRANLQAVSEVILGLPGETLESHLQVLGGLLDSNIDSVVPYTLMMINGAEMNTPAERKKWGIETKYRIIPRDFTRLRSGRSIVEIEEVAIKTNTMSFEDYIQARKVAVLIRWVNNMGFRALLRFLMEQKISIMLLLKRLLAALSGEDARDGNAAPAILVELFKSFRDDTKGELWERPEDIEEYFQDETNFKRLVEGVQGKNVIQTFEAAAFSRAMPELVECIFHHARELFHEHVDDESEAARLDQIEAYCRGKMYNLLGDDRLTTAREYEFNYDFDAWLRDPDNKPLDRFWSEDPIRMRFVITEQQFETMESLLDQFGRSPLGLGKAIIRIGPDTLWRKAERVAAANRTSPV